MNSFTRRSFPIFLAIVAHADVPFPSPLPLGKLWLTLQSSVQIWPRLECRSGFPSSGFLGDLQLSQQRASLWYCSCLSHDYNVRSRCGGTGPMSFVQLPAFWHRHNIDACWITSIGMNIAMGPWSWCCPLLLRVLGGWHTLTIWHSVSHYFFTCVIL